MTVRADSVANREQVVVGIDVERQMLHHSGRDILRGTAGVRHTFDRLNLGDIGMLHEGDRRAVAHLEEAMESVLDPVHPVERDQLHPDDLGEVLDLLLDVLGADCEMMYSVGQTHDVTSVRSVLILCHKRAGSETVFHTSLLFLIPSLFHSLSFRDLCVAQLSGAPHIRFARKLRRGPSPPLEDE